MIPKLLGVSSYFPFGVQDLCWVILQSCGSSESLDSIVLEENSRVVEIVYRCVYRGILLNLSAHYKYKAVFVFYHQRIVNSIDHQFDILESRLKFVFLDSLSHT